VQFPADAHAIEFSDTSGLVVFALNGISALSATPQWPPDSLTSSPCVSPEESS
jgi:hypothetical protein